MARQLAIYGKGGIGKSTISANLSVSLAMMGRRVVQIGCDPKHDSTRVLLGRTHPKTVLASIREGSTGSIGHCLLEGRDGILCIEAGGPEPGVGCAGRGILSTLEVLKREGVLGSPDYDYIVYDVLGDVVCGGFAVPLRKEYADTIFIVTSGEFMSIYAANNIIRGIKNYEAERPRIGGIIFNSRGNPNEEKMVGRFARGVKLPIVANIPRDRGIQEAEELVVPYVEVFPETDISKTFGRLASMIDAGMRCHLAYPISEDDLEKYIL